MIGEISPKKPYIAYTKDRISLEEEHAFTQKCIRDISLRECSQLVTPIGD